MFAVQGFADTRTFRSADGIARQLLTGVNTSNVLRDIDASNQPGLSSHHVQRAILPVAERLGFRSEKTQLFQNSSVPGLRPDYYRSLDTTGIVFEVERGKTLTNNMDLLDLWKCHICTQASILFLFVPMVLRQNHSEKGRRVFDAVVKRMGTFFLAPNETHVNALFVFGY